MKKQKKSLQLSKETIRSLHNRELAGTPGATTSWCLVNTNFDAWSCPCKNSCSCSPGFTGN